MAWTVRPVSPTTALMSGIRARGLRAISTRTCPCPVRSGRPCLATACGSCGRYRLRGEDLGHQTGAREVAGAFGEMEVDLERATERPLAGCRDPLSVILTVLLLGEMISGSEHVGGLVDTIGEDGFLQRDDIRVQSAEALAEHRQARGPVTAHAHVLSVTSRIPRRGPRTPR